MGTVHTSVRNRVLETTGQMGKDVFNVQNLFEGAGHLVINMKNWSGDIMYSAFRMYSHPLTFSKFLETLRYSIILKLIK